MGRTTLLNSVLAALVVVALSVGVCWAAPTGTPTLRLKTFTYVDQEGTGIEAFRFLMPTDWQFEGGIKWLLDRPGAPASAHFRVFNPAGTEALEVFPNQPFFWTDNPLIQSVSPVGSRYFGNEVLPPAEALEVLKNVVIPRYRTGVADLKIVQEQALPELAKALAPPTQQAPGVSSSSTGAKVRLEYQQDEVPMEEEIYGVVECVFFSSPSIYGVTTNVVWTAEYLFALKAQKGTLDSQAPLFQTMVFSFRLNPQWFSKYIQLTEMLIQNQIRQIHNIGELSRYISQTSNEISDMMMDSYNQRQAVYDRISTDFSQMIRGVDEYYDPVSQTPVELPTGYTNAWVNGLGEYVLSDNPNFNPNLGSNLTWQPMGKQ